MISVYLLLDSLTAMYKYFAAANALAFYLITQRYN